MYINLHVHSAYSLLDGAQTIEQIITRTQDLNQPAVALTDHGSMHGIWKFISACKKAGVNGIPGIEAYTSPGHRSIREKNPDPTIEPYYHLVLLAENETGLRNLYQLSTLAYTEGFYYKPRVDYELLAKYSQGVICLSACLSGRIQNLLLQSVRASEAGDVAKSDRLFEQALQEARRLQNIFGRENFFIEIQKNGYPEQELIIPKQVQLASCSNSRLIATCDAHYTTEDMWEFHNQLVCMNMNKHIADHPDSGARSYLRSEAEMLELFPEYPEAVHASGEIANRCKLAIADKYDYTFPIFTDSVCTDAKEFVSRAWAGLEAKGLAKDSKYISRLEYEISTINDMGFPSYFLVVSDFIHWAKEQGIAVGPGRGSAAGSLVAYCLGITEVDPLKYDLLFQRFLNRGRRSMPDIDSDFCIARRSEVIAYLQQRYGTGAVAQIATFAEFKPRGAIRDFNRVQGGTFAIGEQASKLVPQAIRGREPTWQIVRDQAPELWTNPEFSTITQMAEKSDGLIKQDGVHAAAVVISSQPLVGLLPLYSGRDGQVLTQWDMEDVEAIGLVKMDILGIASLTVIDTTMRLIERTTGERINISNIPDDDEEAFNIIAAGDTNGLFQLDGGGGIRELCVKLRPKNIGELAAINALYRPGPLDSGCTSAYVKRAQGIEDVVYLVPQLEPILKETYGLLIYQEQAMLIATQLAGYTLEEADDLRKAIGKKLPEKMALEEKRMIAGMQKNGISADDARAIWEDIKNFADYGFNKSHAVAYSVITYRTAWLKAHFPLQFYCALLTLHMGERDKTMDYLADCRGRDIQVLPPDVNESDIGYTVTNGVIRFGLAAIRGIGEKLAATIVTARTNGPFTTILDFYERTRTAGVNKGSLESLAKAGALDTFEIPRAALIQMAEPLARRHKDIESYNKRVITYNTRLERYEQREEDRRIALKSGKAAPAALKKPDPPKQPEEVRPPQCEEMDLDQLLTLEKEMLGLYVTSHPLYNYRQELLTRTTAHTASLMDCNNGENVTILGLINSIREIATKRGHTMAIIDLEDLNGHVEMTIFSQLYKKVSSKLVAGQAVLVTAKVEKLDENTAKLVALDINVLPRKRLVAPAKPKRYTLCLDAKQNLTANDAAAIVAADREGTDMLAVVLLIGQDQYENIGRIILSPGYKVSQATIARLKLMGYTLTES